MFGNFSLINIFQKHYIRYLGFLKIFITSIVRFCCTSFLIYLFETGSLQSNTSCFLYFKLLLSFMTGMVSKLNSFSQHLSQKTYVYIRSEILYSKIAHWCITVLGLCDIFNLKPVPPKHFWLRSYRYVLMFNCSTGDVEVI